jgi:hypothetical protein
MGSGGAPTRFYGWWTGNAYFVDYDNGSNGNSGLEPTKAKKDLASAITSSVAGDVIYIRPRPVLAADTDPQYIVPSTAANWIVPRTHYNLSIIGAGPQLGSGQIHQTYLRGESTVTTATLNSSTLTVKAPYCSVENLAFHRGGNTRSLLEFYGDGTSTANAWGSSANNCLFRFMNTSSFGAVHCLDSWYCGVYNSHFYRNQIGFWAHGSNSTVREIELRGNKFSGDTTAVDAHIVITGGSGRWIHIYDNYFCSGIPALSGGTYNVYIHTPAMATGAAGLIANNYFATADATSDVTEGTLVLRAGNYDGGDLTDGF